MNARSVEDVLDRLAPREQFAHDWGDVLDRAGVHEAGACLSRPQRLPRPTTGGSSMLTMAFIL